MCTISLPQRFEELDADGSGALDAEVSVVVIDIHHAAMASSLVECDNNSSNSVSIRTFVSLRSRRRPARVQRWPE